MYSTKTIIMKKKNSSFLSFFLIFLFINFGCNYDPVTQATSPDGTEISFSNQGKGTPAILLIHGWTNDKSIWDLQIPGLAEKYQVIAVDLAGHGKSGNKRSEWPMSSFGKDIAAVVNAAGLDEVILVGFSMGGSAAIEAAGLIPEQVKGIILVEAINSPDAKYPPPVIHWVDSTFMDMIENPTVEKITQLGFLIHNPEKSLEKIKNMIDRDQTGWRDMLLENIKWSNEKCAEALKTLSVPVIAINADSQPTDIEGFNKYLASFDAKILSGTGHVLMWDVTEEFNKTLEESIQEIMKTN